MSNKAFIFSIVKTVEKVFGCFCYAYFGENAKEIKPWWTICVDDAAIYSSDKFKKITKTYHDLGRKRKIGLLFAYCNPSEERLYEYAQKDILIMKT
nr:MAG TPA: hypothetical protein [Caudoviricetes sp.]